MRQVRSTEAMCTFSSGECGERMSGPMEIISILGMAPWMIPHSSPAWMTVTSGVLPSTSSQALLRVLRMGEEALGAQPL